MSYQRSTKTRRKVLTAFASGTAIAIAGCSGDSGGSNDNESESSNDGSDGGDGTDGSDGTDGQKTASDYDGESVSGEVGEIPENVNLVSHNGVKTEDKMVVTLEVENTGSESLGSLTVTVEPRIEGTALQQGSSDEILAPFEAGATSKQTHEISADDFGNISFEDDIIGYRISFLAF